MALSLLTIAVTMDSNFTAKSGDKYVVVYVLSENFFC